MTVKNTALVSFVFAVWASGSSLSTCNVVALQSGPQRVEPITEIVAEGGDVTKLHITSDGNTLVTMGEFMLHVWDLPSGSLRFARTIVYPDNTLRDFAVDEENGTVAYLVAGNDNGVVFADLRTGNLTDPIMPAGAGARDWLLPAEWFPVSIDMLYRDGQVDRVAAADAYGNVKITNLWAWGNDQVFSVGERIRTVHWLDNGALLWVGPRGAGLLMEGQNHFFPVTNRQAYTFGEELLVERFVESRGTVVGYNAGMWSARIEAQPESLDEAVAPGNVTTSWVAESRVDSAGIARVGSAEGEGPLWQAYSSGELELRGRDGVLWFGEAVSDIEEANGLPANAFAATPDGALVAVARDVVVSVYRLAEVVAASQR